MYSVPFQIDIPTLNVFSTSARSGYKWFSPVKQSDCYMDEADLIKNRSQQYETELITDNEKVSRKITFKDKVKQKVQFSY